MWRNNMKFLIIVLLPSLLFAHGEEDHGEKTDSNQTIAPVSLTDEAISNLDIQTSKAEKKDLDIVISMFGKIIPVPSRSYAVTSKFNGKKYEYKN